MKTRFQPKLLLALATLVASFGLSTVTFADTVTYAHVAKSELTDTETAKIVSGTPSLTVDGDTRVVLVYEKNGKCTVTPGVKTASTLPHTGEELTVYALVGVSLLGGALLLLKKDKKKATFLLLVLTTGAVSTVALASTATTITSDTVVEYSNGSSQTFAPEDVSCYTYVGYFVESTAGTTTTAASEESTTAATEEVTSASTDEATTEEATTTTEATTEAETSTLTTTETILITPRTITNS